MKIFKFTLNADFTKQILNYSTEVKANQHIPYIYIYIYIYTYKFSNIKYIKRILMNTFLAVYIAKVRNPVIPQSHSCIIYANYLQ